MKRAEYRARLLIVDDDAAMRLVFRRFFERSPPPQGIEVSEAATGEEAIAMLRANEYDCVLSDYRMGAITGIDVLAVALKERPDATRIMMSGFGSLDLMRAANAEARVHAFLEKPMTIRELEAMLDGAVLQRYLMRKREGGRGQDG